MKKYISFFLIFLLIFSFSTIHLNAQENDVNFKKVRDNCAEALVKLNILKGYEDGTLRLDNKILRSEL